MRHGSWRDMVGTFQVMVESVNSERCPGVGGSKSRQSLKYIVGWSHENRNNHRLLEISIALAAAKACRAEILIMCGLCGSPSARESRACRVMPGKRMSIMYNIIIKSLTAVARSEPCRDACITPLGIATWRANALYRFIIKLPASLIENVGSCCARLRLLMRNHVMRSEIPFARSQEGFL